MEDEASEARRTLLALDDEESNGSADLQNDDWNRLDDDGDEERELKERLERTRRREVQLKEEEYQDLHRVYVKAVKRSFRNMKRFPEPSVGAMWTEEDEDAFRQYEQSARVAQRHDPAHHTDPGREGSASDATPTEEALGYPQLRYSLGVYDEHMFVGQADDDDDDEACEEDDTTATSATINRPRSSYGYAEEDDESFEGKMVCEPTASSVLARLPQKQQSPLDASALGQHIVCSRSSSSDPSLVPSSTLMRPPVSLVVSPRAVEPRQPMGPKPFYQQQQGAKCSGASSGISSPASSNANGTTMMAALAEHRGARSKFVRKMRSQPRQVDTDEEEE